MYRLTLCVVAVAAVSCAAPRPSEAELAYLIEQHGLEPETINVVQVPDNCPTGQAWINGQCRDVWIKQVDSAQDQASRNIKNVVGVPDNCPTGQQLINGQCRDVWRQSVSLVDQIDQVSSDFDDRNVISVPDNCKEGQQLINGVCRDVWRSQPLKDSDLLPSHCPIGLEYIKGECRNVLEYVLQTFGSNIHNTQTMNLLRESLIQQEMESRIRNIIDIPGQCPNGYKPDANGNCRQIWSL